jgi:hypothetical protein
MTQKGMGSHEPNNHKGQKDEWLTPPHVLNAFPEFDLDPCAPINPPWKTAKKQYTIEDDGLSKSWFGTVWLNPPYGKETVKWLQKLAVHNDGIALIFARTETKTFFPWVWDYADSILFLKGRLTFYHIDGSRGKTNGGAPSVLIAYGKRGTELLKNCGLEGKFLNLSTR